MIILSNYIVFIFTLASYELLTIIPQMYYFNIPYGNFDIPFAVRVLIIVIFTALTLALSLRFYRKIKKSSVDTNKKAVFLTIVLSYVLLYATILYHFILEFDVSLLENLPSRIVKYDIIYYIGRVFYCSFSNINEHVLILLFASFFINAAGIIIFAEYYGKILKWIKTGR